MACTMREYIRNATNHRIEHRRRSEKQHLRSNGTGEMASQTPTIDGSNFSWAIVVNEVCDAMALLCQGDHFITRST